MPTIETGKRLTKAQLCQLLTEKVEEWIANGIPPDKAINRLTQRQYDFLVDQNVDFDKYLLTETQRKAVQAIKRNPRSCSPNGYNKKYPQSKKDLYNGIAEYLKSQNAQIIPRTKQNFRDLDFILNGISYKIVLSNPRTETNNKIAKE